MFAGLAGSLGALAAVAVTAAVMRSRRNRAVFAALVLFMTGAVVRERQRVLVRLQFRCAVVEFVPVSSDSASPPSLLGLTVLVLLVAAWFHFSGRDTRHARTTDRWQRDRAVAVGDSAWLLVAFEVYSLTAAMIGQYPAWTVGRSNIEALSGKTCGLANDVMVEQDPNAGMLTPVGVPIADGARRRHR